MWQSLQESYSNVSSLQITQWPWIPLITSFLQASLSLAPPDFASTLWGRMGKLWVVTANCKWGACYWHMMVEARSWALCGNCVVLLRHSVYRSFGIVDLVFIHDLANTSHYKWLCILCGRTHYLVSGVAWFW